MAKFYDIVGYGPVDVEIRPGIWEKVIVERTYSGDVIRNARRLNTGDSVNDDISVTNTISIVADPYANEHFFAILYVKWAGSLWKVTEVEVQRPRLLLRLGGVYNGDTAATSNPA